MKKGDRPCIIEANNSPKSHNDVSCLILLPNNVESLDDIHEFPFEPCNVENSHGLNVSEMLMKIRIRLQQ